MWYKLSSPVWAVWVTQTVDDTQGCTTKQFGVKVRCVESKARVFHVTKVANFMLPEQDRSKFCLEIG